MTRSFQAATIVLLGLAPVLAHAQDLGDEIAGRLTILQGKMARGRRGVAERLARRLMNIPPEAREAGVGSLEPMATLAQRAAASWNLDSKAFPSGGMVDGQRKVKQIGERTGADGGALFFHVTEPSSRPGWTLRRTFESRRDGSVVHMGTTIEGGGPGHEFSTAWLHWDHQPSDRLWVVQSRPGSTISYRFFGPSWTYTQAHDRKAGIITTRGHDGRVQVQRNR
jgi:hypothetical protein